MKKYFLILSIATIFLASCISPPHFSKKYLDGKAGNLAVISLLGDRAEITSSAITVFSQTYKKAKVPGWEVDKHVVSGVIDRLKEVGHTVTNLDYDADALMGVYKYKSNNLDPIHKVNRAFYVEMAKRNNIDKLIVIYRAHQYEIIYGKRPSEISGYGLFRRVVGAGEIYALASVRINVIDGTSGEVIEDNADSAYLSINAKHWHSSYSEGKNKTARILEKDNQEFKRVVNLTAERAALSSLHNLGFL